MMSIWRGINAERVSILGRVCKECRESIEEIFHDGNRLFPQVEIFSITNPLSPQELNSFGQEEEFDALYVSRHEGWGNPPIETGVQLRDQSGFGTQPGLEGGLNGNCIEHEGWMGNYIQKNLTNGKLEASDFRLILHTFDDLPHRLSPFPSH